MFSIHSNNGYTEVLPGIQIKTLCHGASTLMTEFLLQKGATLIAHSHPHEQTGYLIKGKIQLFIGKISKELNPGDSWCIPSNIEHKAEIMEDSVAIEVFSPLREDYLKFENRNDIVDNK